MDEIEKAKLMLEEKELKSYEVRLCKQCGSDKEIYFCENVAHEFQYCRDCIKATYAQGNSTKFLVKCKTPICTFYPYARHDDNEVQYE